MYSNERQNTVNVLSSTEHMFILSFKEPYLPYTNLANQPICSLKHYVVFL